MILDKLQKLYNEITGQSEIILTKKTKINDDIGLSSFSKIRLLCLIEEEFGVQFSNQELMRFKTIGDIIKFLSKNGIK